MDTCNEKNETLNVESETTSDTPSSDGGSQYPTGLKLGVLTFALCLSIFIVALDTSIIATAIPKITDDFHALEDIGWYASSYLMTTCAFQLFFGRLYTIFSVKYVFLSAIAIFEVGSLLCGVAPNSPVLILGRAVAGTGCAGIFSGALLIIYLSVPLGKRPAYTGFVGAMYGVASVAGPLLGGVFTDQLTWRWVFYINLPIGAVTILIIVLFFQDPQAKATPLSLKEKLKELDLIGTAAFVPSITCLLLALQWGGSKYPWKNGRIIALFILAGVLFAAFVVIQVWKQDKATVPPRIFKQRSILCAVWFAATLGSAFYTMVYYLPIWFQAVKEVSATESGIRNIPTIIGMVIMSILAGIGVSAVGYYVPFMIASAVLVPIGLGLMCTFTPSSGMSEWIGYQALFGMGVGVGTQQPLVVVQTVLKAADAPIGTALVMFAQMLGGTIGTAIAQTVFATSLISHIQSGVPALDPQLVLTAGATNLKATVGSNDLGALLKAYNTALTDTFHVPLVITCLMIIAAVGVEWVNVKQKPKVEEQ